MPANQTKFGIRTKSGVNVIKILSGTIRKKDAFV